MANIRWTIAAVQEYDLDSTREGRVGASQASRAVHSFFLILPMDLCDEDIKGVLSKSFPYFLELLKTNKDGGIAEFDRCARPCLEAHPLPIMYAVRNELGTEIEDIVGDIILSLIKNDARRLRSYKDKGDPFKGWLNTVARNYCIDRLRPERPIIELFGSDDSPAPPGPGPDPEPDPEVLARVLWRLVERMDRECHLAIKCHYQDGLKPKRYYVLLGYKGRSKPNVKASTKTRDCVRELEKMLKAEGYSREDFGDFFN